MIRKTFHHERNIFEKKLRFHAQLKGKHFVLTCYALQWIASFMIWHYVCMGEVVLRRINWQYVPVYFIDIYECYNNNCTNGATCKDGVNGYTCICMSGYTGTYCEIGL